MPRCAGAGCAAALADFDAATIATTHQFCQQVLTGLGVAGDSEPAPTLVESLDDLVVEVVDDLYVRGFAAADADRADLRPRDRARSSAAHAIGDPQARLEPPRRRSGQSVRRAGAGSPRPVRDEVDRRKRRLRVLGYDDLLSRVAGALVAGRRGRPGTGCGRAGRSCWSTSSRTPTRCSGRCCERAFAGHATLVLIGDPKQAIYAFRGGDIDTYLAPLGRRRPHATLARNWRSDAPLVDALQALIGRRRARRPGHRRSGR